MVYLPEATSFTLDVPATGSGRKVKAQWINPQTGKKTKAVVEKTDQQMNFTTPKGWEDALLVIKVT